MIPPLDVATLVGGILVATAAAFGVSFAIGMLIGRVEARRWRPAARQAEPVRVRFRRAAWPLQAGRSAWSLSAPRLRALRPTIRRTRIP